MTQNWTLVGVGVEADLLAGRVQERGRGCVAQARVGALSVASWEGKEAPWACCHQTHHSFLFYCAASQGQWGLGVQEWVPG